MNRAARFAVVLFALAHAGVAHARVGGACGFGTYPGLTTNRGSCTFSAAKKEFVSARANPNGAGWVCTMKCTGTTARPSVDASCGDSTVYNSSCLSFQGTSLTSFTTYSDADAQTACATEYPLDCVAVLNADASAKQAAYNGACCRPTYSDTQNCYQGCIDTYGQTGLTKIQPFWSGQCTYAGTNKFPIPGAKNTVTCQKACDLTVQQCGTGEGRSNWANVDWENAPYVPPTCGDLCPSQHPTPTPDAHATTTTIVK